MGQRNSFFRAPGVFIHQDELDIHGIGVDLRYASANNIVGSDLYAPFDCAWLHREAAERLEAAAKALVGARGDLRLTVLDAVRPQRVQQRLWDRLEGTDLRIYFADPARGSIHSFGMAVDVTLVATDGRELDMGTPFDDLTERSHPARDPEHQERNAGGKHGVGLSALPLGMRANGPAARRSSCRPSRGQRSGRPRSRLLCRRS